MNKCSKRREKYMRREMKRMEYMAIIFMEIGDGQNKEYYKDRCDFVV